ncbi:Checkpoint protein hus1 [Galdieria sulphuraria]|uniref:Checkpoint protein n=1 Tax=Galdieria sulphuraria TaxID=130081 RepID=M2X9P4_GALSU|nr:HUS1 checkpoint protein [Galdieria sulphuraria]EME26582.1 HUS1 checkpoint protein [Galdieria sulphuraria]GJD07387.1 Checkpoint protein hus1 [Galdieria sulphuraria]|eukprot:XP_005703102.1 HUS1 checkpoint protein [Galdieria sulphuraria]
MKFRTLLVVNKVVVFAKLLSVLQKVEKTAFLILCSEADEEIRLVTKADAFNGLYTSALLRKSEFFEDYRIESKYHNLIGLEFQLSAFEDAIRASSNAAGVIMKLSKKEQACISFHIQTLTSNIIQDVPVRVITPTQIEELAEPNLPPCSGVVLSPLQKIAILIEKFRHVSQSIQLTLQSTQAAELHIKCHSETLEVETCIKGLKIVTLNSEESSSEIEQSTSASVDGRHLSKAMFAAYLIPQRAFCFILSNLVLLHIELSGVDISYYLPVIIQ